MLGAGLRLLGQVQDRSSRSGQFAPYVQTYVRIGRRALILGGDEVCSSHLGYERNEGVNASICPLQLVSLRLALHRRTECEPGYSTVLVPLLLRCDALEGQWAKIGTIWPSAVSIENLVQAVESYAQIVLNLSGRQD
jgi:hypothetical protein